MRHPGHLTLVLYSALAALLLLATVDREWGEGQLAGVSDARYGLEAGVAPAVDAQDRGDSVSSRSEEVVPGSVPTPIKLPPPQHLSCRHQDICFSRVENASSYALDYPLLDGSRGVGSSVTDDFCHCNLEGDPNILCRNLPRFRARGEESYELRVMTVGDPPYASSDLSDAIVVDTLCQSIRGCGEGFVEFLLHQGEEEFLANDGNLYCGSVLQRICIGEDVSLAEVDRLADVLRDFAETSPCQYNFGDVTFGAIAGSCIAGPGILTSSFTAIRELEQSIAASTEAGDINWKPLLGERPTGFIRECFRLNKPTLSLHFSDQLRSYYLQWSVPGLSPGDRVDIELQLHDHDAGTESGVWGPPTLLTDVGGIDGVYALNRNLHSPEDRFRVRAIPSGKPSTSLLVSEYSEAVSLFPPSSPGTCPVPGEGDQDGASGSSAACPTATARPA